MPHITLECSPGIQDRLDVGGLLNHVYDTVVSLHICRPAALRLRLYASPCWRVGEGEAGGEAVHVAIEARKRPPEVRRQIVADLHAALKSYLGERLPGTPCQVSVDIRDLDDCYLTEAI